MGAAGLTIVLHAFTTSTSSICLRVILFKLDLEPSVATSLQRVSPSHIKQASSGTYQTVATPYLRFVKTLLLALRTFESQILHLTFVTVEHGDTDT